MEYLSGFGLVDLVYVLDTGLSMIIYKVIKKNW